MPPTISMVFSHVVNNTIEFSYLYFLLLGYVQGAVVFKRSFKFRDCTCCITLKYAEIHTDDPTYFHIFVDLTMRE